MKRGLGSQFGSSTDDNFDEQEAFNRKLREAGIQKSFVIEKPVSKKTPAPAAEKPESAYLKKKRAEQQNGTPQKQEAEKPKQAVAPTLPEKKIEASIPLQKQMAINGITLVGMSKAVYILDESLTDARQELAGDARNLIVADNLTNFYYRGMEVIDTTCTATRRDIREVLETERAKVREMKEVSHQMVVDKFDEAKRVLDTKKDAQKSFDLIVEATMMCERDLTGHQQSLSFQPCFMPKIDKE